MTKFKVGDKVRILDVSSIVRGSEHWHDGDVVEVTKVAPVLSDGEYKVYLARTKTDATNYAPFLHQRELQYIEKVSDKPTKNQRIETLESEVATLKAEVEALKKAQEARSQSPSITQNITVKSDADIPKVAKEFARLLRGETIKPLRKKPELTPNGLRKAIIAEAKAFVEDAQSRNYPLDSTPKINSVSKSVWWVRMPGVSISDELDFVINAEKRTVVALIRTIDGELVHKGIAKCAPDDVFNADIGKAIALGRALGLDITKFEQAVKPTEVVVGQVVENYYEGVHKVFAVLPTHRTYGEGKGGKFLDSFNEGYTYINKSNLEYWSRLSKIKRIIDDTEAQYD